MKIYLDIETLPSRDPEVASDLAAKITPPGNISKPETIAAWEADKKPGLIAEAVKRTSFDGLYGSIACIAWAMDDGPVQHVACSGGEDGMLQTFFEEISRPSKHGKYDGWHTFIGHNIHGFDLPFIKHRAIVLGIKPPALLLRAFDAKPWAAEIEDTMLMWSTDREKRVGLDKLCKAFGIPGKDGFDGSMVADTWPTDPEKVIAYCMDDVNRVRAVYKRLTFSPQMLKDAA